MKVLLAFFVRKHGIVSDEALKPSNARPPAEFVWLAISKMYWPESIGLSNKQRKRK